MSDENTESENKRGSKKHSLFYQCYKCGDAFRTRSEQAYVSCSNCSANVSAERARINYFSNNQTIRELSQGPIVGTITDASAEIRGHIQQLKPPKGTSGSIKSREQWDNTQTILYLIGDERRAVTKFIDENPEFIEDCLSDGGHNPIRSQWDDAMYQLLLEQWHFTN